MGCDTIKINLVFTILDILRFNNIILNILDIYEINDILDILTIPDIFIIPRILLCLISLIYLVYLIYHIPFDSMQIGPSLELTHLSICYVSEKCKCNLQIKIPPSDTADQFSNDPPTQPPTQAPNRKNSENNLDIT